LKRLQPELRHDGKNMFKKFGNRLLEGDDIRRIEIGDNLNGKPKLCGLQDAHHLECIGINIGDRLKMGEKVVAEQSDIGLLLPLLQQVIYLESVPFQIRIERFIRRPPASAILRQFWNESEIRV
jgi:hypothetical protein